MSMPSIQIPTTSEYTSTATTASAPATIVSVSPASVPDVPDQPQPQEHSTGLALGENVKEVIMENQVVINTFIAGK